MQRQLSRPERNTLWGKDPGRDHGRYESRKIRRLEVNVCIGKFVALMSSQQDHKEDAGALAWYPNGCERYFYFQSNSFSWNLAQLVLNESVSGPIHKLK